MIAMGAYLQKLNMLLHDFKAIFLNLQQLVYGRKKKATHISWRTCRS